ncbi:NAD-dependent epimerase/dehydratase family protein [bacterium]|nr:NAD-dependent epimerase/dehydratase family protein [bacterium]
MKVLVTGTAGFIGFHLAHRLLSEGHQVAGIDNFNNYYPVVLKHARHAVLEAQLAYKGYRGNLADMAFVRGVAEEFRPDVICNLAAQPGVRYSLINPHAYAESNLDGFLNVLEVCRHLKVPRLVYASSSSVYGNNTKLPFSESDPVDHPISLYAATKKANELMAHTYSHLYKFETVGLRFFTVYGPWGRPDMATWLFTQAISEGRAIKVFNHGDMQRDFTYVDDIVAGVRAALTSQKLDRCEVLNIGNHRSEKLMDMIRYTGEALGLEPKMELLPMQPGDVNATYADIEKARTKLDFEPTTALRDGLRKFVEWYRAHPELTAAVAQGS